MWFGVMTNALVHIIMYTYYFMSALGPKYQKYLWWKSYITKIQLTQFIMIVVHAVQSLFRDCNAHKIPMIYIALQCVVFFKMFADFYKKSYFNKNDKLLVNGHNKIKS